ncbi:MULTISPECIES: flippase activity-associated protein Agl23 [Halorussus]|uniref:flippase activity-associated protein Agl23 n=1 Tax=Halorussus TaxID=1070314 RepID=UPI0020A0B768|nr:flippase activity-associated protein Agl23 [Halorussus vallis]USZ77632.1 TIGR03663 family protein [Halorussus vallis]
MASETKSSLSAESARETLTGYANRTVLIVGAITVLALAARFFALGYRVAHQDEARVAYWAYRFMVNGVYEYRPIVHGPFLTIVNGHLFGLFGASDFVMRLVPALFGGLLPLTALLLRERLRASETVALALVLAFNPLLLYYSRFYRNDVLLAGFMLVAFAFFVRAYDDRRPAYLYAGTAAFALAFTTKENSLVYPVTWAGAAVLLWDYRLLRDRADERGLFAAVWERVERTARGVWNWGLHFALAVVEFFAIVVFFYAPRNTDLMTEPSPPSPYVDVGVPGLYEALGDPTLLPAVVGHATLGSWHDFVGQWGGGNEGSYLSAFKPLMAVLEAGAIILLALALVGFVLDRYTGEHPSDVVSFATYWGAASILGYPVIVDNPFPWETIHMIMPLVVPAAVGLAFIGRLGLESLADGDALSATAAALLLVVMAAQVGATVADTTYINPQSDDNELVQYAQSSSEMKPLLHEIRRVVRSNQGIDVLYYGSEPDGGGFHAPNPDSHEIPPAGTGWFARLPFAWYMEAYGAETDSVSRSQLVGDVVRGDNAPPVVITFGNSTTCSDDYENAADIQQYMDGYERHEVQRFSHDSGCTVSSVVVYVNDGTNSTAS